VLKKQITKTPRNKLWPQPLTPSPNRYIKDKRGIFYLERCEKKEGAGVNVNLPLIPPYEGGKLICE
jgi:hypothetical protein